MNIAKSIERRLYPDVESEGFTSGKGFADVVYIPLDMMKRKTHTCKIEQFEK